MQARLTLDPVNFRPGDVAAVVADGRIDDLVQVATGPTAHASKQRQLVRELLQLRDPVRAAKVAEAIANRSEAVNTVLTSVDLFNAGAVKRADVEGIVNAVWRNLTNDQQKRLISTLAATGASIPTDPL